MANVCEYLEETIPSSGPYADILCDSVLDLAPAALPNHLCQRTMRASTERFIRRHYQASRLIDRWASAWPLPVGKGAMRDWFRDEVTTTLMWTMPPAEWERLGSPEWQQIINAQLIPAVRDMYQRTPPAFLADRQQQRLSALRVEELPSPCLSSESASAALIVEYRVAGGRLICFGPVDAQADDVSILHFAAPVIHTEDVAAGDAIGTVGRQLKGWYARCLQGQQLGATGKPYGSSTKYGPWPGILEAYLEAVLTVYRNCDMSVTNIAKAMDETPQFLHNYTSRNRLPYPPPPPKEARRQWNELKVQRARG